MVGAAVESADVFESLAAGGQEDLPSPQRDLLERFQAVGRKSRTDHTHGAQTAPGQFGQNDNQSFQYVINYSGQLTSTEQFGNIIIKALGRGQYLQLKNIARIELGAQSYTGSNTTDGKQSVGISISQTPGSNARQVIQDCQAVINQVLPSLPAGVKLIYLVNINDFLDASISKVLHTLFECFGLVFLVIFIFL